MKSLHLLILCCLIGISEFRPNLQAVPPLNSAHTATVDTYDPSRHPAEDLELAVKVARKSGKRILLEVGGDWCIWCHRMDSFFEAHSELKRLRDENYLLIKVHCGEEIQNDEFLSQYPPVDGYPHFFILESDGKLMHSKNTAELEKGESYDLAKFTAFLNRWARR